MSSLYSPVHNRRRLKSSSRTYSATWVPLFSPGLSWSLCTSGRTPVWPLSSPSYWSSFRTFASPSITPMRITRATPCGPHSPHTPFWRCMCFYRWCTIVRPCY
uniref:Uncharacterized protein n=1 Tax=Cacopsylla melanoneura TaxID=428564 RepID=A0A8D8TZD0_9HEMI